MFGWLSKKNYNLAIGQGQPFALDHKETVLNGALRQGVAFPHSCKVGGCGACKCKLESGKVKELTDKSYLLSREEIREGFILGCQSIPVSDVVISLPEASQQRLRGTIVEQRRLTHDIAEIRLRLEGRITYLNGQYASLKAVGTDIPARCYSYAHRCEDDGSQDISFFVRAVPHGRMSHWLLDQKHLHREVEVSGSLGEFHLRHGSSPLLCVAGGSGLAPLMAMLEGMLGTDDDQRDVTLLMGARTVRDLYCLEEIDALCARWRGRFEFVPVLSEEPADSGWRGQRGWVTEAITAGRVRGAQGYLCGPPPMIDACISLMTGHGMSTDDIHFDKFSDQATANAA